jgi:hypothetical protein
MNNRNVNWKNKRKGGEERTKSAYEVIKFIENKN